METSLSIAARESSPVSGDKQIAEADGAGTRRARALVRGLRAPLADGGWRERDARRSFAEVGGALAVELPAEDGIEAFDLDHDGAGGGGRDLHVDAQPFARGGLRGGE